MSAITAIPGPSLSPAAPVESGERTASRAPVAGKVPPPPPAAEEVPRERPRAAAAEREELATAARELSDQLAARTTEPRRVDLRYDREQRVYVVEVREERTGELIIQFPPEKILNMRGRMDELIGTVIDHKS